MVIESNELNLLWVKDGVSQSLYTWIKYSHKANGENLSDDPTGMEYIGIAYNKTEKEESNDPNDYTWSRIQGNSGTDAYTVILSNENVSFATSSLKIPLNEQTATCRVMVLQGTKPRTDYVIGNVSSPVGITVKVENKTITMSVSPNTGIIASSGAIDIPIEIDGISFTKQITYSLAMKGEDGDTPVVVYLSNENCTFAATTDGHAIASQVETNAYAFSGSTQVSTNVGNIIAPTGINVSVVNNEKLNTSIVVSVTKDLTKSGSIDIPVTVGKVTYHISFNYTLSRQGADGTPAKSIDVTASSQIFKSTDGGVTFSPDIITLTPRFQGGISYSKWCYSNDGGKTWTQITNENGISINSGVLSVSKTSTLYTEVITSIVFKCVSNDESFYDTCTISKIYDVVDIRDEINSEFTQIKSSISGVEEKADKANKSITDKVWQTDITETINNYDDTTVKDVRDRVSNVETNLSGITSTVSDMKTTIENKADGSTVTKLEDRVTKAEQDASGFKQTVESTYAKQTDLNNLEIGGRNLFINSSRFTQSSPFSTTSSDADHYITEFDGKYIYTLVSFKSGDKICIQAQSNLPWSAFHSSSNPTNANSKSGFWLYYGTFEQVLKGTYTTTQFLNGDGISSSFKKQIVIPEITGLNDIYIGFRYNTYSDEKTQLTGKFWNLKLERGDKITDWTPAPEDIDASINNVNQYAKTSFEQLSDKFTWIVTSNSSSSSLTLTDSVISAITKQFVIKDSSGNATIISGGKINANSITAKMLSSDAIKSNNYIAGTYTDGAGYSTLGTFIDLSNGVIHTPGLYTDATGNAYFNGTVNAYGGWFGTDKHNWYIGSTIFTDIMNNDGALTGGEYSYLKATDNVAIVVNEWHLQSQNDGMSLQSGLSTLNNGKFVLNPQDNKYYDFGMVKPDMSANAKSYNKKFLYIRRANTPTTHPQEWEYLFHVDYDGSIWYKGKNIAGDGVFLPVTGGTITGDLTVSGTLNATATQAKKVTNALSINGKAYDGSSAINVGNVGIAYGGTGASTDVQARINLSAMGVKSDGVYYGLMCPSGSDEYWIRTTQYGLIPYQEGSAGNGHSNLGTSTWYFADAYIDNIHGTADRAVCDDEGNKISTTYLKSTSSNFDSITVGNMIVNGTARFVNGLMGTLTGNVIGNVQGNSSTSTLSQLTTGLKLVSHNEIKLSKGDFAGGEVHIGYTWIDGTTSPLITEYQFHNNDGNGTLSQVTASQFNGKLNGVANYANLLSLHDTSSTITTNTSTWRNGVKDGYVVWGQRWKDTRLSNDTGDITIWLNKGGSGTTANMTIDGAITAGLGFIGNLNGNASTATTLQTSRKIGNASFNGSADITLSDIGASAVNHTHSNYASSLKINNTSFAVASNTITVTKDQLISAIGEATGASSGFLSASDKSKLNAITISETSGTVVSTIRGSGYIKAVETKGIVEISHESSGVTAGTYGANSTNPFYIPRFTVDATGHITSASYYDVTATDIINRIGTSSVNRAKADSDGNTINSTYLKLSGGAMTGNIAYKGSKATYNMIKFIDNPNDTYGNGVAIGGGGAVIIGGGESSDFCKSNYISDGGNERLILANDGVIDFYVNCQENSTSKAVHTYIDSTGKYIGVSQKATQLETSRTIFGKSFNGTTNVSGQAYVYGDYVSDPAGRYAHGGLQIRENGLVANNQSDIGYAPAIGFHWSNRIAATLLFHSDGRFYFRKQNGTDRATVDADLNAGSISTTTANIYGTATFTNMSIHNGGVKSSLFQLQGTTAASIAYGSTNPKIRFMDSDGSQIVELMYTDYDSVRYPAGLAVRGNQGNEYFDVPHLYATQVHVDNHCALQYDSSNQCLNFVFS